MQVNLAHCYVQFGGYYGPQELAVWARVECRWRKYIKAGLAAAGADFPNEIIGCLQTEPGLENSAYAVALVLRFKELPCALCLLPELHKTLFVIFNLDHSGLLNLRL